MFWLGECVEWVCYSLFLSYKEVSSPARHASSTSVRKFRDTSAWFDNSNYCTFVYIHGVLIMFVALAYTWSSVDIAVGCPSCWNSCWFTKKMMAECWEVVLFKMAHPLKARRISFKTSRKYRCTLMFNDVWCRIRACIHFLMLNLVEFQVTRRVILEDDLSMRTSKLIGPNLPYTPLVNRWPYLEPRKGCETLQEQFG